jgi:predicted MFS family arabinose efflux permease
MSQTPRQFTAYQKVVVALLVFLQFTIVLDFMIMAPLGALIMPTFKINPSQFGLVVSAYAFSAGVSGLLAAGFADKFDRKKMLLFFYVGFVVGTLLCALSPNYYFLLFARMVTGLFGGVIGSIVLAIATDLFDFNLRGRVIGLVQTAFGASQILGIPLGLYLSNVWGWHAPFFMIVIASVLAGVVMWIKLEPIDAHLKLQKKENIFRHFLNTFNQKRNLIGFSATALISIGGFLLMPFTSAFTVHNLGVAIEKLPFVYLSTGLFAIFLGPFIGRMSDKVGKLQVFIFGAFLTIIMVLIYTHLGVTPLPIVIFVNILFFIGIFSRIIPSQALISAIPTPAQRGSFMAVNSSLQQISGGVASVIAGLIVVEQANGSIAHFDTLGFILVATTLVTIFLIFKINQLAQEKIN